jgi:D-lactate dehydrogenase (cytochrome)
VLRLGNRCRKSASGYHLLGLLVGSEGTLAIATELTLAPGRPAGRPAPGGLSLPDGVGGGARHGRDHPLRRGRRRDRIPGRPDRRRARALSARSASCRADAARRGAWQRAGVDEAWQSATEVMRGAGGEEVVLPGGRDAWTIREQATRAIGAARPDAAVVRADVAIRSARCRPWSSAARRSRPSTDLGIHLFGHAGIGILHALVLADPAERAAADAAREALVAHALALGGSCSGEHGMGLGNRGWAAREHGAALPLMQGVKALFDPHGILNPGKMW